MAQIIYGIESTSYNYHLIYINVLIGKILIFLLQLFPNIPWYTVFQCFLVFSSFAVIINLMLKRFSASGLVPVFLLVFFFGNQFFLQLQFSKTAAIAVLAGILLLFDTVTTDYTPKFWKYLLGGLLTIFGSLYRFQSFGVMLILLFGIGLSLIREPFMAKHWKKVFSIALPFVIILSICVVLNLYNTLLYKQNSEWVSYQEFNTLRSELLDYGFPDYDKNKALYESLSISRNDLDMFLSWDFADPEIFNINSMRQLVAAKEERVIYHDEMFSSVKNFFFNYRYSPVMLAAILISTLTSKGKHSFILFYTVAASLALQIYFFISGRYGLNRIDVTIACCLFCILVLYAWDKYCATKWVCTLFFIALFLSPFATYQQKESIDIEDYPSLTLLANDKDHLYVRSVSTTFPLIPEPYDIYPIGLMANSCCMGGWNTYTDIFNSKLNAYGVENLFRDLVDNPKLYYVTTGDPEVHLSYIRRHYAPKANAYLVKVTEDGLPVYRVSTTGSPVLNTYTAVSAVNDTSIHYDFYVTLEKTAHMLAVTYTRTTPIRLLLTFI